MAVAIAIGPLEIKDDPVLKTPPGQHGTDALDFVSGFVLLHLIYPTAGTLYMARLWPEKESFAGDCSIRWLFRLELTRPRPL
jgi:hypothetical protein